MKLKKLLLVILSSLVNINFTLACTNGTAYSSQIFNAPVFSPTIITNGTTSCINSGQYFKMGTSAGVYYQVNSSISTDYVTVTDNNGFLVGSGNQPYIFQTNTVSTVHIFIHASSLCPYDNLCRAISVSLGQVVPFINTYPSVTQITSTTATSGGLITNNGSSAPSTFGVAYSINPNPTIANTKKIGSSTGGGYFTCNLTNLSPNTTYYLRAYATNLAGTGYGSQVTFTTAPSGCLGTTQSPSNTVNGSMNVGQVNTVASCVYAGTYSYVSFYAGNYTISSSIATDIITVTTSNNVVVSKGKTPLALSVPSGNGLRVHIHKDTLCGAEATCRVITFVRNSQNSSPSLITTSVNSITFSSANAGGYINNAGSAAVTSRGLCYSTSPNPTISGTTLLAGTGTGVFSVSLIGLNAATKYYLRAFATNSTGTSYGQEISFTTSNAVLANVSTNNVILITDTTAQSGGNVTSAGSAPVTAKGICYSTSANPTTADIVVNGGSGLGGFTNSLVNLTPGTTYHVRAFATTAAGTSYGINRTFTTTAPILATISTTVVTNITSTTAVSGGNVSSAGGSSVSSRGVCYSTSPNPTLADNINSGGSGTGLFTSNLSGLLPNTTYYLRAYATNNTGTAYGNQETFTTSNPTSILTHSSDETVLVGPNPFIDEIYIDLGQTSKPHSIRIYDCFGRMVQTENFSSTQKFIEVKKLPGGIYFIEIDSIGMHKLIKN